jgi:hypothetical protein
VTRSQYTGLAAIGKSLFDDMIMSFFGDPGHCAPGQLYCYHRYLIPRLSLKVVYLWRHVSSTAPPFILWWWNLETLFAPPQPQLSLHRRAALSSDSNGTRSCIAERTQSAVYIVRCLCTRPSLPIFFLGRTILCVDLFVYNFRCFKIGCALSFKEGELRK